MAVIFSEVTKHGGHTFLPNAVLGFEDAGAEDYFVACGWASRSTEEPTYVYPEGSVEIDPETRHNESGLLVQDMISKLES